MEETLYKAVEGADNAGYFISETKERANGRGALAGIAGIGLSLLCLKNKTYLLDDFFMLSSDVIQLSKT